MEQRKQRYEKFFRGLGAAASVFVAIEIILQLFGTSICPTGGCKIVSGHVRYGDLSILFIGLATFLSLTVLAGMHKAAASPSLDSIIDAILILSLASEGYFTGYQAFGVKTPCLFCLVIFSLVVVLGVLRLAAGRKEPVVGFFAFAAVFGMVYLVPPAASTVTLPQGARLVLFYSKDCKHCAEVIKEIEDKNIVVTHLEVSGYADFLNSVGVERVPTLLVNDPYQKIFLTGKDEIDRYLQACTAVEKPAKSGQAKAVGKTIPPAGPSGATVDIFNQTDILTAPAATSDEGMCKQDEICK